MKSCPGCVGAAIVGLGIAATWHGSPRALAVLDDKPAVGPALAPATPPSSNPATPTPAEPPKAPKDGAYVLDYTLNRIDGKPEALSVYQGKVVLIVNVASLCGYTSQYEGLQALYSSKKDDGFVVLGFPANNFGSQEPGKNEEIAKFCMSKFSVTFPMFEKISVLPPDQHPLYKKLAEQPAPIGGDPKWNFTKFLVDRSGKVVARYESRVRPDDAAMAAKIDELLKAKP